MAESDKLHVFLSYAREDRKVVRGLYKRLLADGFDPWLDEERLLPGQDWNLEIEKAMRSSDAILLCFSELSVQKEGYIQREYKRARSYLEEKPEGTIYLIPVRLDDCEIPYSLREIQWVDYPDGYSRLVQALTVRGGSKGTGKAVREKNVKTPPGGRKPVSRSRKGGGSSQQIKVIGGEAQIATGKYARNIKAGTYIEKMGGNQPGDSVSGTKDQGRVGAGEAKSGFNQPAIVVQGNLYQTTGPMYITQGDMDAKDEIIEKLFSELLKRTDSMQPADKEVLKPIITQVQEQAKRIQHGDESPETLNFFQKRLKNLRSMSSDIGDVVIAALVNPALGFSMAVKKIAAKVKDELGEKD